MVAIDAIIYRHVITSKVIRSESSSKVIRSRHFVISGEVIETPNPSLVIDEPSNRETVKKSNQPNIIR